MAITIEQVRAVLEPDEPNYEYARALNVEAIPLLEQLVHGTDPLLASKAAYAVGLINSPEAVRVLESAARSSAPPVRVAAAAALSELPSHLGTEILIQLFDDPDRGVRRLALQSAEKTSGCAISCRLALGLMAQ
jgi:HEAT repeat protein